MDQLQFSWWVGYYWFEIFFWQVECEGESVEQMVVEGENCVVVGQYLCVEIWQIGLFVGVDQWCIGEYQWMVICCLEVDIESFFMVWFVGVVDFFFFWNVVFMVFGVVDVIVYFFFYWQGEDLFCCFVDVGDQCWVDIVVGDVEKVYFVCCVVDGVGYCLMSGEVIVGQIVDIDGWEFSKSVFYGGYGCGFCLVSDKNC